MDTKLTLNWSCKRRVNCTVEYFNVLTYKTGLIIEPTILSSISKIVR